MNTKQSQPINIVICGNYGIGNLGDEAILQGVLRILEATFPRRHITVLSSNPSETSEKYQVEAANFWPAGFRSLLKFIFGLQIIKTFRDYLKADLFILGGGGLFADEKPRAIVIWTIQAFFAFIMRKKLVCFGQSVGPLRTKFGKTLTKFVFNKACFISVRDSESKQLLQKIGVLSKIQVLTDPAFALSYDHEAFFKRENFIVLSLRPWIKGNHEIIENELAKFINWIYLKHGLKTVFIPFQINQENDLIRYENLHENLYKNLKNKLGKKSTLNLHHSDDSNQENNPRVSKKDIDDILSLFPDYFDTKKVIETIASSRFLMGMRLHSVIFSVLTQTPFIGLSYSEKVKNFIKCVNMSQEISYPGWIDYEEITFEKLKIQFEWLEMNYNEIKMALEKAKLKAAYDAFEHIKLLQSVVEDSH